MREYICAIISVGFGFSACLFGPNASLAQTNSAGVAVALESPIGKVMTVSGAVTIERATVVAVQASLTSGAIPGKIGDHVHRGDVVQTGANGKIGIVFTDGTAFNLSPNARMILNEYVYDPKGNSNSTLLSLTKGSLTFIAGAVAKTGDMKIDTPVATMGIRGTTPHVEISESGTVTFATLVEEIKVPEQQRAVPQLRQDAPRQRQAGGRTSTDELTAQQAAKYNKLFNMEFKICRGC